MLLEKSGVLLSMAYLKRSIPKWKLRKEYTTFNKTLETEKLTTIFEPSIKCKIEAVEILSDYK